MSGTEILIQRTQFTVAQFLSFQRNGELTLSPSFQRKAVWKPKAKSYLIDTVVRGFPIPIIFLRERVALKQKKTTYEVVDGQQRLRTLFSYIDESSISNFNPISDRFLVAKSHNRDIGGTRFDDLDEDTQKSILGYQLSTHILPASVSDQIVLQLFARMNSTGVKATDQELRNAKYFGEFKQTMYELAYEQLEHWRKWKVFSEQGIARMKEVELVSDIVINFTEGSMGKDQTRINSYYESYDEIFAAAAEVKRRFRETMELISEKMGNGLSEAKSAYRSEAHFFTLVCYVYDRAYGLGSDLTKKQKRKVLPDKMFTALVKLGEDIAEEKVPDSFRDAYRGAATDSGRRQTRLNYFRKKVPA